MQGVEANEQRVGSARRTYRSQKIEFSFRLFCMCFHFVLLLAFWSVDNVVVLAGRVRVLMAVAPRTTPSSSESWVYSDFDSCVDGFDGII